MKLRTAALTAMLLAARVVGAQTAADHIAQGDREHASLNFAASLHHYEAAITADPRSYDALWKAARDAVELGEFDASAENRTRLYKEAEGFARRAVQLNPGDAEGHFHLARAIGRNALTMGTRDRIKFAGEVRREALEALRINPQHDGALHVMGVWNAEVMRLNGLSRMIARNFLGGQVFGQASWPNAVRYMEQSVAVAPNKIVHHLDLGRVYADVGDRGKAREQFAIVARLPISEFNDRHYKDEAARAMRDLR